MSIIRTIPLFIFLLGLEQSSYAQLNDIDWGDLQRKRGSLIRILPRAQGEFFALRWTGGQLMGRYTVSHHRGHDITTSRSLQILARNSIANFEGVRVFNHQFTVFLSDRSEAKNHFYLQYYSDSLERDGEEVHLAEYPLAGRGSKGHFTTRLSPNEKFLAVIWQIPGKKKDSHVYGFKVYNEELEMVNEGEYKLPFPAEQSIIHEHFVSDKGSYFLCLSEYAKKPGMFSNERSIEKKLHIYHLNDAIGIQDYELELEGKWIESMAMHAYSDSLFTLTGIYGDNDENGVSGIFYKTVNLQTEEVVQEGQQAFEEDFITQDWPERTLERSERRQRMYKGKPQLYNYVMRDVIFPEDGGMICTLEQYFVQMRSSPDIQSSEGSSVYYYYYNDIISYRTDSSGGVLWIEKIPKYQVSMNDGGPYSGFESFVQNGSMYFVFNDDIRNYDEGGTFMDSIRLHTASYGRRRNAVALVQLDLGDGEIQRKTFFDPQEHKTLVVPKLFTVNRNYPELIIYSVSGSKEKIGILPLEGTLPE